ncbi:MAG TPA: TauD/TfdA family dioxygenase [Thermoanaerobaculia bacterium]|nr:TauD/TfdA family dioxygenase [Thermoanaerobaculia bacterium]
MTTPIHDRELQNLAAATSPAQVDALNREFYGRFPYPWAPLEIDVVEDPDFERVFLNQALGDFQHGRIPRGARIWVAGCGTNQAVFTALRFPQCEVLGSDLSVSSLAIAAETAKSLGVGNLELRNESLNEVPYESRFDYVLSTGVIHHNSDPALTLARLRRALKPSGILELMVYNSFHWLLPATVERVLALLAGGAGAGSLDAQMELARRLVEGYRPKGLLRGFLTELKGAEPAQVADVLLQPVAHSYTVESLRSLVGQCGLELLTPTVNQFDLAAGRHLWEPELEAAGLGEAFEALPDEDRWLVANLLLLEASPMLWFYLQRTDAGKPRPSERQLGEAFLDTCFEPARSRRRAHRRDDSGAFVPVGEPGDHPPPPRDPLAQRLVAACDGRTPMRELLERSGVATSRATVNRLRVELTTPLFPHLRANPERKGPAMQTERPAKSFKSFTRGERRSITLGGEELVGFSLLDPSSPLPLVATAAAPDVDLGDWARDHRGVIEEKLREHAAILFRGFGVTSSSAFRRFAGAVVDSLYEENGEHPRDAVEDGVYTPVFYPPDQMLLWHNENSFNHEWPQKIIFCCVKAAAQGGQTPVVDSRAVYREIPPAIREEFTAKGVMYVRNYGDGLGLDWRTLFRTAERSEVERLCARERMEVEWKSGDRLRTRSIRPAVVRHRVTGELAWFNQAQHWHPACLDAATRRTLDSMFEPDDMPRNCFFGDGSVIPDEHMREILAVYARLEQANSWREGDVMLVDNVLAAHGRKPFSGERKLLVALGDTTTFET